MWCQGVRRVWESGGRVEEVECVGMRREWDKREE